MELIKSVPSIFMANLVIFANTEIYVKPIEKLSRRHFINSFDVFNN